MSQGDPVTCFEMDLDYCSKTFGIGLCGASLDPLQIRTNSFLWSQDFSNAYWTKANITLTAGDADPYIGPNAFRFFPTIVNGLHRILSGNVAVTSGTTYTVSAFVKKGINLHAAVQLGNNDAAFPIGANHRLTVNLDTGAIAIQGSSLTAVGVEDCGGGWWRVWASAVAQSSINSQQNAVMLVSGTSTTFIGVVTDYVLAFGAQFETGSKPSRYKVTTTATVSAPHGGAVRKCYNTWATCKSKIDYEKSVKTYKYVTENGGFPIGQNYIPALKEASGRSGTVNIAGSDDRLSAIGERAVVQAKLIDFADSDILTDKYQPERISGAAQTDEPGYNPINRLTHWTKFKARNPNYAGRPARIAQGRLNNGVFTVDTTRNFVLTNIKGPDSRGNVTIEAKDILTLADNNKAVAPKAGRGFLSSDITADIGATVTLLPVGIGAEYDAIGVAVIGSEIVNFTRSGDILTLTARGERGTVAAAHKINDTVQPVFAPRLRRIDRVVRDLLRDYAGVPSAYIPFSEWQAECNRWAPNLLLTADICKPEGVASLIGELAILGVSIWWDDVAQKIQLKVNRPPDTDTVKELTDAASLIAVSPEDRDDDRLTRVSFWTVQIDPTKGTSKDNFLQQRMLIDVDAESASNYNGQKLKEIYCRWLNHGADALVRILSKRLLNRFNNAPVLYELTIDAKDNVELASVLNVTSRVIANDAGKEKPQLMQVISRNDLRNGDTIKIKAQKFQFDQRYGYVTENTRPVYNSSSAAQKARGAYFVNNTTLVFGDATGPYVFS